MRAYLIAGSVGIVAAAVRMVCTFFPYLNLVDLFVFGIAGFVAARAHASKRWLSYLLVILPSMVLIGLILGLLGSSKLREGVGAWHLRGAVIVPLAASIGFLLGRRPAPKRP